MKFLLLLGYVSQQPCKLVNYHITGHLKLVKCYYYLYCG